MRGLLIVFEGVEGAGKSTQLERLAGHLARAGVEHLAFREPGGTPLGDEIRRVLLDPATNISPLAEALLFLASRAELVAREVRPALQRGVVVLLDRYFLSTYAYQMGGRGLPASDVRAANLVATEGLVPDLTLLLMLPADVALARATGRGGRDRIEQADDAFHGRVAQAFAMFATREWQASYEESGPIVPIDATGDASAVEARVVHAVTARFPALRKMLGAVV